MRLIGLHHGAFAFAEDLHLEFGTWLCAISPDDAQRDRLFDAVAVHSGSGFTHLVFTAPHRGHVGRITFVCFNDQGDESFGSTALFLLQQSGLAREVVLVELDETLQSAFQHAVVGG